MDHKPEKPGTSARVPRLIWGIAIFLWAGLIYALFFLNFIRNFISTRGG